MTIDSRETGDPLSSFEEDGRPAVLNYNLPDSTTYLVVSRVRLGVARQSFQLEQRKEPAGNYWDRFEELNGKSDLTPEVVARVLRGEDYLGLTEVMDAGLSFTAEEPATSSGVKFKAGALTVSSRSTPLAVTYAANKIAEGFRPQMVRHPSGKQGIRFLRRPEGPKPAIYLVMKMRMASFLGDYGAGRTISTFSLLPGERTTIEVRDYRHREETRTSSESVLDNYSESAVEDLQSTIESSTDMTSEFSDTDTDTMAASVSASGGIDLLVANVGAGAEASASSERTTSQALTQQVATLSSAVSHHVQSADTKREVEIKTDVTETETTETETTTVRTLENINKSRVLNYTFRQLNQEFFTITYLDEVSLAYSNGYDSSRRTSTLSGMDAFLESILEPEAVIHVKNSIHRELCNIADHTDTRVSFIEKVVEERKNCIEPSGKEEMPVAYVRKRRDLRQSYRDKFVEGIILGVDHHIMRTPAVIVEALLGRGESLDRYNQELQEAAYAGAHLANRQVEQAMSIIDAIEDPAEKAKLYNHVFGNCCGCEGGSEPTDGESGGGIEPEGGE